MIEIDVLSMSTEQKDVLFRLVYRQLSRNTTKLFMAGQSYVLPSREEEVRLSHTLVVQYFCTQQNVFCYVSGKQGLGEGNESVVYAVEKSFVINPEGLISDRRLPNPLIVKIQNHIYSTFNQQRYIESQTYHKQSLRHEVANLSKLPHAGYVAAVAHHTPTHLLSAIVMKRQPGVELFELISFMMGCKYVTSQFRLQLSIALLQAYQKQLYDFRMIHGDIKPENIQVNVGMCADALAYTVAESQARISPFAINFIDYASARAWNDPDGARCPGTASYRAPEVSQGNDLAHYQDEKIDIYPLGVILYLIWGFHRKLDFEASEENRRIFFEVLFDEHHDSLTYELFLDVYKGIMAMRAELQADRSSLPASIRFFHGVQASNNLNMQDMMAMKEATRAASALTIDVAASSPYAVADLQLTPLPPAPPPMSPMMFGPAT